jgi:hypothetical protein
MISLQKTLDSLVPQKALSASISIVAFSKPKEELFQFATGTLLKVGDVPLLVTAAHVFRRAKELGLRLAISSGKSFLQLSGDWFSSSDTTPYDIAVVRLTEDITSKLTNETYIRLHDVDFNPNLSKGVFCLLGYPNRLSIPSTPSNITMRLTPFQYLTYAYEGETDKLEEYQNKYHLLLVAKIGEADEKGNPISFIDLTGTPLQFPKDLGGISGCSIWKIGNYDKPVSNWKHHRPKVVAVQTGVYSGAQIIKATKWVAVSNLIDKAYPDLRPAMKLLHVEY